MYQSKEPITHQLIQITKKYLSAFAVRVQQLELERYHYILVLINDNDELLTQKGLAEILQVNKSQMVAMIDYLSSKGYVKRKINPTDRREQLIKLTDKARKDIAVIENSITELNKKAVENLTENEIRNFNTAVNTIQKNLNFEVTHEIEVNYNRTKSNL